MLRGTRLGRTIFISTSHLKASSLSRCFGQVTRNSTNQTSFFGNQADSPSHSRSPSGTTSLSTDPLTSDPQIPTNPNKKKKKVYIISGTTGTGKTAFMHEFASRFCLPVVSGDLLQVRSCVSL